MFATTRDELLECAALVRGIRGGAMDALTIPRAPLDILAQQLVAFCAAEDEWEADALYAAVRAAYPYRDLARKDFDDVVTMLAEGVATSRGRSGAFLHHDRVNGRLRARRGARMAAIMSGGAIPETANYNVVAEPDGHVVGTVDEDFAVESMAGDIFLLGSTSWQIRRVESGVVRVENANGAPPSIPFWNGESPGRTIELSREVSALRAAIDERDDAAAIAWLTAECGLDRAGAEQAVAYVRAGKSVLGTVPTGTTIVAERFFDEGGGMQLILHTPFGARINRAWGLALRKKFCRSFNLELQAAATDNGICLSLTDQHAFPLEIVFEYVKSASVEYTLTQAMLDAPMFGARWRWNATRALAILRMRAGKKVAPQLQRMRADDLLASVFPDQAACAENLSGPIRIPDHVLVRETIDNCLHEAMDLDGLIERAARGRERRDPHGRGRHARAVAVLPRDPQRQPLRLPRRRAARRAPRARRDAAPHGPRRRERRQRHPRPRRDRRGDGVGLAGGARRRRAARRARDADRAAAGARMADAGSTSWSRSAARRRCRAARRIGGRRYGAFWTCAERLDLARIAYPDAIAAPQIAALPSTAALPETREDAFAEILRGWLESSGPLTVAEMTARFARRRGDGRVRAAQAGDRRPAAARALPRRRGRGVVQPARAGAHPPAHAGHAAARDRAGHDGGVRALPVPLAARRAGRAPARHRRHAARHQAARRLRDPGRRLGERRSCPPASRATSASTSTGCAMPAT